MKFSIFSMICSSRRSENHPRTLSYGSVLNERTDPSSVTKESSQFLEDLSSVTLAMQILPIEKFGFLCLLVIAGVFFVVCCVIVKDSDSLMI
jgi:hypothetical protein